MSQTYDICNNTLNVVSQFVPREIHLTLERMRENDVYSARVWRFVPLRTATREVRSYGDGIGRCQCSECQWEVGVFDSWCRSCGARFVDTHYERV